MYDALWISSNARAYLKALPHQARTGVRFAIKANSHIAILKILKRAGIGADVVSGGELEKALYAGIDAKKIVFSGVGKTTLELKRAIQAKIGSIQVESLSELDAILKLSHLSKSTPIPIGLRLNPSLNVNTHKHIHTSDPHSKFGLDDSSMQSALKTCAQNKQLSLQGISAHMGSQITELESFRRLFDFLRRTALHCEKTSGTKLKYVSVGGGLGICYQYEDVPTLSEYGSLLGEVFMGTPWKIYSEPGRCLLGPAGDLIARVVSRKQQNGKHILVLDAGMNDLLRPALYGAYHEVSLIRKQENPKIPGPTKLINFKVVGPVCESTDVFHENISLPEEIGAGDLVRIRNVGAYGFSMASTYNVRPLPGEYLYLQNKLHRLRKPRPISDLWRDEISL